MSEISRDLDVLVLSNVQVRCSSDVIDGSR